MKNRKYQYVVFVNNIAWEKVKATNIRAAKRQGTAVFRRNHPSLFHKRVSIAVCTLKTFNVGEFMYL